MNFRSHGAAEEEGRRRDEREGEEQKGDEGAEMGEAKVEPIHKSFGSHNNIPTVNYSSR